MPQYFYTAYFLKQKNIFFGSLRLRQSPRTGICSSKLRFSISSYVLFGYSRDEYFCNSVNVLGMGHSCGPWILLYSKVLFSLRDFMCGLWLDSIKV